MITEAKDPKADRERVTRSIYFDSEFNRRVIEATEARRKSLGMPHLSVNAYITMAVAVAVEADEGQAA